jgi:hypothetical protein
VLFMVPVLVVALGSFYLGLVGLVARFACKTPGHRRAHVVSAALGLPLAAFVTVFGLPWGPDARGGAALLVAAAVLALAPVTPPGHRPGVAGAAVLLVALTAYLEPVVRVHRLTRARGDALRAALDEVGAPPERYFVVLTASAERARALRVDMYEAYYVNFVSADGRTWHVRDSSYPPQQLAWYEGNSGQSDCPYPVPLLVVLRGITGCGM